MKLVKPTLVTATIIYLIVLIPSIVLAPFSFFLYKSEESTNIILHIFAILWLVFPLTLLVSILGSWLASVYNKNSSTTVFLILPIIHSVLLVIFGLLHFAS